jgi:fibronectin-binding autotransporter adhesin
MAALLCVFACPGFAVTLIYDDDGLTTNGITDGTTAGWNTTTTNTVFYNGSTDVAWTNSTTNIAQFGGGTSGTAGSLAVGTVTTNGILFETPFAGSYALTGGTITLGGTAPTLTADANASIASTLTGTAGFTKAGAGTLTLTGNNTALTGTINLNTGTLSVVDSITTGTGSLTLIKALGNAANPLMLNGGTLQVLANGDGTATAQNLTLGAYNTTVTADSAINVDRASGTTAAGKTIILGNLSIGANTLTVSDGNNYGVRFGNVTLTGNTTFNVVNANSTPAALTLNNIVSTTNSITKTGAGSVAINAGTFGALTINAGNVDLTGTGTMGDVTVTGTGNFTSHSSDNWTMNSLTYNSTSASSNFNAVSGSSTYTINGGFSMSGGSIAVNASNAGVTTKVILKGDVSITGTANLTSGGSGIRLLDLNGANRIFTISGGASFNVAPVVQNGGVDKEGAGTLKFTAVNTYAGGTTVGAGILQLSGSGTLGDTGGDLTLNGGTLDLGATSQTVNNFNGASGAVVTNSVASGGRLTVNGTGVYAGTIVNGAGSVALTKNNAGTLALSSSATASNTYTGGTILNGGTLLGTDSTVYTGTSPTTNKLFGTGGITMADGTTLQVRVDGDGTTAAQTLSYGNAVTLTGSATVDINRNVSATAKTKTVAFGNLTMAAGTLNVVGGNSYILRFNTLTLTGAADFNVGTGVSLMLNSAIVGGANAITKDGVGTLTLQNGGVFGDFTINAGLADVFGADTTGNVTVNGSGAFSTHSGDIWTMTSLSYNSTGTSSFTAFTVDSTYTIGTGGLTMSKGTIQLVTSTGTPPATPVNDKLILAGDVTITGTSSITKDAGPGNMVVDLNNETRSFNVSSGATFTVTPTMQNGAVSKTGDGIMAVSGANTYSGGTVVSQGTFLASNTTGSATGTGAVNITGGTLGGAGIITPDAGNVVTVSGTGVINPGAVTGDVSGTLTINGDVVMDVSAGGTPSIHMDMDGKAAGQFDRILGVGNMTLDGTITVAFAGGYTGSNLVVGNSFDLFDWSTVSAAGFNVGSDLVLPDISTFGLGWDKSHFLDAGSAGGVISVISAVPEPSRVMMLGVALGVGLMRRRRRGV